MSQLNRHLWKVVRIDDDAFGRIVREGLREGLVRWIADVTPLTEDEINNEVRPGLVISQDDRDRQYRLHLTRMVYEDGELVINYAADRVHDVPLVYPIPDFPKWLLQQGVS